MAEAPIRISATDESKAAFVSLMNNMKRAEAGAKSFTGSFDGLSSLTGKLGALSAAISAASIGKLVTDGIAAQAALDDLSESTSLSVETLSQLQNVTRLTGADLNTVAASAGKFARSVAEARTGNAELVAAFRAVGISTDDLKNKNFDDLFVEFARAIAGAKDPTDALGVAVKLAGKSAADVIPFFKDLAREGLGVAKTTGEQAAAAERLQNEFRSIRRAALDLRDTLANLLVPALARFIEEFRALKSLSAGEIFSSSLLSINRRTLENAGEELARLDARIKEFREGLAQPMDPRAAGFLRAEIAGLEKQRTILEKLIASIGQQRRAAREAETPQTPGRDVRLPPEAPKRSGSDIDALTRARIAALPPDDDTGVDLEGRARGVQQRNEELTRRLDSLVSDTLVRRTETLQSNLDFLAQALVDGKVTATEYAQAVQRLVDPTDQAGEATRKLQADVEAAFGDTAIARAQRLQAVIDEINRQADAGTRSRAQADQAIANLVGDTNRQTETTNSAARDLGLIFSSSFEQAMAGGRGLRDILKGIEADILKLGTRKLVTEPFLEWLSPTRPGGAAGGGSAGGGFGQIFDSLLKTIGFRASGGPVMAGGAYIVGERGPEFFVPKQSGTIVPNGAAMGGNTVVFNIQTKDAGSFRASQGQIYAQAQQALARAGKRNG